MEAGAPVKTVALVVAGGSGSRAGGLIPKQYQRLGVKPVLRRTLEVFACHNQVDAVLVVIGNDDRARYTTVTDGLPKLLPPVVGGSNSTTIGSSWP